MQNKNMEITENYEELYKTTCVSKYLLNLKVLQKDILNKDLQKHFFNMQTISGLGENILITLLGGICKILHMNFT